MNFEKDVHINEQELDLEALNQPKLTLMYGKYKVECETEMKKAKERFELIKAELRNDIRTNPNKYGLDKVTIPIVEDAVLTCDKYKKALEIYRQAEEQWEMAKIAYYAIQDKKESLSMLIKLLSADYFKGPEIALTLGERVEQREKKVNKKVSIEQPKKKKIRRRKSE